jgi:predicted secreted protein
MSKKLFSTAIVLLFVFSILSCGEKKLVLKDIPESKLERTYIVHMNERLEIKLASNPSTGFSWYIGSKIKPAILKEIGRTFLKDERDEDLVGAGGYDLFFFEPKKEGVLFLSFIYKREDGSAEKEKFFKIIVEK